MALPLVFCENLDKCDAKGVDGLFGPNTYNAIQCFQVYVGLSCDGIVGPNTWFQLESWTNNEH